MSIHNRREFKEELNLLLKECKKEMHARESNIPGIGTINDFQQIIANLEKIKSEINTNRIPSPEERYISIGAIVIHSWPLTSKIGERLCGLASYYKRRLR